jgi:hypothetical protein
LYANPINLVIRRTAPRDRKQSLPPAEDIGQ